MTAVHIRPFLTAEYSTDYSTEYSTEYSAFTHLKNAVYPDYESTVEMVRHKDKVVDPRCRTQRFLAKLDGRVIGSGEFTQNFWVYHPRKFDIDIQVLPAYRRRGIGSLLLQRVMATLEAYQPWELWCKARADMGGPPFLSTFGFGVVEEEWEYRLDPAGFDFTPYAGLEEILADQGIHIVTMSQLMVRDPAYKKKLYALDTGDGTGQIEEVTLPSFDLFSQTQFDATIFLPDAYFVAVQDGRYLGTSNLEAMGSADKLMVGYTGVLPAYRRRGIALALKLRTIQYAVTHGNLTLITSSISSNRPMMALNERLGFIRRATWIRYKKELATP